jgi:hypothetical protein
VRGVGPRGLSRGFGVRCGSLVGAWEDVVDSFAVDLELRVASQLTVTRALKKHLSRFLLVVRLQASTASAEASTCTAKKHQ